MGIRRHQATTAATHLFLSEVQQDLRGKNPELTVCQVSTAVVAVVRTGPA
jgi:hypothetical protein